MNERIRELAIQAGFQPYITTHEEDVAMFEKFAESIVRECMWKIMTRKEEAIDYNWDVDEAMSATLSDISEHFGVES